MVGVPTEIEVPKDKLGVLDVSTEVDPRFGGYKNDIRVESACVDGSGMSG
jgi:hypothetical protein